MTVGLGILILARSHKGNPHTYVTDCSAATGGCRAPFVATFGYAFRLHILPVGCMRKPALIKLALFLLGIAIGAIGAANIVNVLRQRDAYPRGVMSVMQHHYAMLRQELRLHRCNAIATTKPLASLREFAGDLEQVFYPDDTADAPFGEYAQRLRDVLAGASGVADCPALAPTVDKIGAACDACHREYR